jgi:hypothetical protein
MGIRIVVDFRIGDDDEWRLRPGDRASDVVFSVVPRRQEGLIKGFL